MEVAMAGTRSNTDQLVAWLDDAYAMESGLIGILQNHAAHFSDVPQASRRIEKHITETRQHAARLEQCLQLLGTQPSMVKSTLSSVIGSIEGATTAVFRDQLVKDVLADYAAEQFEIGCYTALVSAATRLGHPDVAELCQQNLREDKAMAAWLLRQIPAVLSEDRVLTAVG
jgi:ferritin-like metal-binding protein YciE